MDQPVHQLGWQVEVAGLNAFPHFLLENHLQVALVVQSQLHIRDQQGLWAQWKMLCKVFIRGGEIGALQKSIPFDIGQNFLGTQI